MTIYIYRYSTDTPQPDDELVDQFTAETNKECEAWAEEEYSDTDYFYWTYTARV